MAAVKELAYRWVDEHREALSDWHRTIWEFAEPAWREYRSAAWFVERLRHAGFTVESGSGGMPTAFAAEWSNGPGAAVAGYAEYDAVPGNCQAAATTRGPRPGLSEFAPGHTDPHSALGVGALGGIFATQHAMRTAGVAGTLRFFGEPAEKVQGSKLVHGLRGYYDGIDAIVSFHPFYMLPLCNTTRWDTHCGAYCSRIYSFICDTPETWGAAAHDSPIAAAHSAARAPGANVALFTMYALTKASTVKHSIRPLATMADTALTVYTIGHSTRTMAEFGALLGEAGVHTVVDVRAMPGSRRNPQFNIEALPASLAEFGVGYQHIPELGGRRHRPRDAPPSPNIFWRNDSFRNYADYAATDAFNIGLTRLQQLASAQRCAIMCSEAVWWRCHRRIISDYLLAQGMRVLHIMGPHKIAPATLTPSARRLSNGTLVYQRGEVDSAPC